MADSAAHSANPADLTSPATGKTTGETSAKASVRATTKPAARRVTGQAAAKTKRAKQPKKPVVLAEQLPVAKVAVDIPLAHLDRPFDYLVPERLSKAAVPGCRVRVRFSGQLMDGYLLERAAASDHQGRMAYLERVVSPEPVLSEEIAGLARVVADRYAGTFADVLRLAVPPRHAAAESAPPAAAAPRPRRPEPGSWTRYPAGAAFLTALHDGRGARAAWSALPGPEWPAEIARAAGTTASAGRGTVIVVPAARDLARVDRALTDMLGEGQHVCLTADLGPAERYRRWLAVRRGAVRIVAGTRSSMFAPVSDLGLVVLWDDGDDLHAERRAPYPHAREVLALRAHRCHAAALIGGFTRTAEITQLVAAGWAKPLEGDRPAIRRAAPLIRTAADDAELARDEAARTARLPSLALRTARGALSRGPVLVQVPRRGYLAVIACGRCRAPARCAQCGGPLEVTGAHGTPCCRWCGRLAGSAPDVVPAFAPNVDIGPAVGHDPNPITGPPASWRCPHCQYTGIRALVTGATRTAEELSRAFPSVPVRASGGQNVIANVSAEPALVVATPGAEPVAAGGYAAALLLDGWALAGRPSLRASEEALRRWLNAASLVRPAAQGGEVILIAEPSLLAAQALIRWDPVTHAERELAERTELGFPPAVRMAAVTGGADAVEGLLAAATLPADAEILGPVPADDSNPRKDPRKDTRQDTRQDTSADPDTTEDEVRALIRVPRPAGAALARALQAAIAARSTRKGGSGVRVQLDPAEVI